MADVDQKKETTVEGSAARKTESLPTEPIPEEAEVADGERSPAASSAKDLPKEQTEVFVEGDFAIEEDEPENSPANQQVEKQEYESK
jgi:hypothetical protein